MLGSSHVVDDGWRPMSLAHMRARASLSFAILLWVLAPVVCLVALSNGNAALPVAVMLCLAATVATVAWRLGHDALWARLVIAAALTFAPIGLVWASAGGAWQIDYHMIFFVIYAALVVYVDWRPIAIAATLTAFHHLILDTVDHQHVFPEEGLGRVVLHAVAVIADGAILYLVVLQMKRLFASSQRALARAEAAADGLRIFESAIDHAEDRILISKNENLDGHRFRIVYANRALESSFGYAPGELIGNTNDIFRGEQTDPDAVEKLFGGVHDGIRRTVELTLHHRDGRPIPFESSAHAIFDAEGRVQYVVSVTRDISERKAAQASLVEARIAQEKNDVLQREIVRRERVEADLLHAAFHDALTGLPNRALLHDRLDLALKRSHRRGTRHVAVLFLDCDRFKNINDTFGHATGDALLKSLAQRLEDCLRPGDTLARIGGDEFIVLCEDIGGEGEANSLAQRILDTFSEPFSLDGLDLFATASIGVALNVRGDETSDDMLRNADIAMYRAKDDGKRRVRVFRPELGDNAKRKFRLENDLRSAVERREIEVFYQSILTLDTGGIAGFEALARWRHAKLGLISPAEFIPIAEEIGLIGPISDWVLLKACRQAREWQRTVAGAGGLTMNVNVSAAQLLDDGFVEGIAQALRDSGLPPHALHLEITESVLMSQPERVSSVLHAVRDLGVELHLDDFGTGYSSLAYLHRFPVSALKIDRSFVSGNGEGLANPDIVETVIALARQLQLTVTAEGIETAEQRERLRALACTRAQGYLFSRPLEMRAATDYLIAQYTDRTAIA